MKCKNCNTNLSETAKLCNKCGAPVNDGFPWGKVSFNPFKWNPLGLTRSGTWVYIIIWVAVIVLLLKGC